MTGNDAHNDAHNDADDRTDDRKDVLSDRVDTLLRHSIRTAPMMEPPPGFAQAMEARVSVPSEQAWVEVWLTRLAVATTVLILALATLGLLDTYVDRIAHAVPTVASDGAGPLLLAAIGILALVKLAESLPPVTRRSN